MKRILQHLIYTIYYNKENKTVYIVESINTTHLPKIRYYLDKYNYDYENIKIGKCYYEYTL